MRRRRRNNRYLGYQAMPGTLLPLRRHRISMGRTARRPQADIHQRLQPQGLPYPLSTRPPRLPLFCRTCLERLVRWLILRSRVRRLRLTEITLNLTVGLATALSQGEFHHCLRLARLRKRTIRRLRMQPSLQMEYLPSPATARRRRQSRGRHRRHHRMAPLCTRLCHLPRGPRLTTCHKPPFMIHPPTTDMLRHRDPRPSHRDPPKEHAHRPSPCLGRRRSIAQHPLEQLGVSNLSMPLSLGPGVPHKPSTGLRQLTVVKMILCKDGKAHQSSHGVLAELW